jgi:hypothetical protein
VAAVDAEAAWAEFSRNLLEAANEVRGATGQWPIAVTCHPDMVGADRIMGVTVILDPNQPRERVDIR